MTLSSDESRALAFIALVVALAAAARVAGRGGQVHATLEPLEPAVLATASDSLRRTEERRRRPLGPGETLDPNTAPAEELQRLPRVSRALAERIVAERQRGGPFTGPSDLTRVPGIGPRTAERLAPFLDFASAAPTTGPPGAGAGHTARVATTAQRQPAPLADPGSTDPAPLDLNRASAAELERLPGIGPVLAARIVAYRDSIGRFRSVDELDRVRGIGPALLERIRPHLSIRP
ncbi:MAG: ComEA family DNA-binding protein [bacterium]|jgi:competence ComEA-like helix-hairpin-helix protein|nr:MAG: hypothetical protein DIU52_05800 [bacterium]